MKIIGLEHRVNGVLGYQKDNGNYIAILKAPNKVIDNATLYFGDPYNWADRNDGRGMLWHHQEHLQPIEIEGDDAFTYYTFELSSREMRFKYFFVFESNNKTLAYGEGGIIEFEGFNKFNFHEFSFTWNHSTKGKFVGPSDWWCKTNWYQVFPDRFASDSVDLTTLGDAHDATLFGGNLKGIIEKIDYIKDLGFNGVYLNPIFKATSPHKYDTIDYFEIDPDFGSMEDFDKLVSELKKRDMKIMLDGVFNHCGWEFPMWLDVIEKRNESKFKDWFTIWDMNNIGTPEIFEGTNFHTSGKTKSFSTFGNTPSMPRLNWSNPEVSDYVLSIIEFWTKKGIDAWRMDVADEVSFEMWRQVRQRAKSINPECVLLGEIWYDAIIFMQGDQFDTTMNYPFKNNAFKYFIDNKITSETFVANVIENKYKYSANINKGLFNLLGSHDTKRLFLETNKDNSVTKMMWAWLILSQGVVSFYYGDEINLIGNGKNNREAFDWKVVDKSDMYNFIKMMMNIRNENIDHINSKYTITNKGDVVELNYNKKLIVKFDKNNSTIQINDNKIKL